MNDQPAPKLRNSPLPESGYLVLRGLSRGTDREAAVRFLDRFPGWQEYGLSGFYAASDHDVDALCGEQLQPWHQIAVFKIEDLRAAGLGLHPTFRTPHITITHPDLDQLIYLLDSTFHDLIENPYYESND